MSTAIPDNLPPDGDHYAIFTPLGREEQMITSKTDIKLSFIARRKLLGNRAVGVLIHLPSRPHLPPY